jgi:predicted NAD-dependent protein-ADP-ribosyltransferase YbiA (DUF1768 family)
MALCLCLTKKGIQCKNQGSSKSGENTNYCSLHQNCPTSVSSLIPNLHSLIKPSQLSQFFLDNDVQISSIKDINCKNFAGPTDSSNWVIRNQFLIGGYPYNKDLTPNDPQQPIHILKSIGITDFISLQTADEDIKFIPYQPFLTSEQKAHKLPIIDRKVVTDTQMLEYMKVINAVVGQPGHKTYLHCFGGHGRTGVATALFLGFKYHLPADQTLQLTQKLHDCRERKYKGIKGKCPQTAVQFDQVNRLLSTLPNVDIANVDIGKVPIKKKSQLIEISAKIPIKKKVPNQVIETVIENPKISNTINFYDPKDPYGEFSNFYGPNNDKSFQLVIDGQSWQSSEHYFQAQKFLGPNATPASIKYANDIARTNTANKAAMLARQNLKKLGAWGGNMVLLPKPHQPILIKDLIAESLTNGVTLRSDWNNIKDDVMLKALAAKFVQNPKLAKVLLSTGQSHLVEHTSRDSYWGDGGDGSGLNKLGLLLMKIRSTLAQS